MLARLTTRTLARHRGLIAGMTAVLAGFQVLMVAIAANLQREGLFPQISAFIPPSVQAALGGNLITSFGGFVSFGFFHPVVVLALAVGAAYLAGETAGDVEDGMIDLLAARPVPRALLVTRAGLAALIASTLTVALMFSANWIATALLAPRGTAPAARALALLALNLLAVTWCCAGAGLLLATLARKRSTAAGAAALAFVSLYLVNFAAAWWAPVRSLARLSPFHYFEGMRIMLRTKDPTGDIVGLLAATAACLAVAYVVYQRRDL